MNNSTTTTDQYGGVYSRLSPRPDGSYEGVDLQEQWGQAYATANWPAGLPLRFFSDAGLSAFKDDVVRPGYNELCAAIDRGEVAYLWTVEQSRLERQEGPWFAFAARLEAAGLDDLHTNRDGVVKVGDVVAGIKAVLNAAEVRKLKRRVNDTLDARAEKGIPPGSRPYGYTSTGRRETRTYVIEEAQAKVIRWVAGRVMAGWSLAHIAADLREQGVHGPHRVKVRDKAGRILLDDGRYVDKRHSDVREHAVTRPSTVTPQAVRGWLMNPSVAGLRTHRGEVTGPGNWEPILDRATWEQVRVRLVSPRTVRRSDGRPYSVTPNHNGPGGRKYLLTGELGLGTCGVCGAPLTGSVKQMRNTREIRSVPYLLCHPNLGGKGCVGVLLEPVERHVADELFAKLDTEPEFAAALSADRHAEVRAELAAELTRISNDRVEDARRKARREITAGEWDAMREVYAEQEASVQQQLRAVPPPLATPGSVDWKVMRDLWDDPRVVKLDERRAFLRRYVQRVTVNPARPGIKVFDPARVTIEFREV